MHTMDRGALPLCARWLSVPFVLSLNETRRYLHFSGAHTPVVGSHTSAHEPHWKVSKPFRGATYFVVPVSQMTVLWRCLSAKKIKAVASTFFPTLHNDTNKGNLTHIKLNEVEKITTKQHANHTRRGSFTHTYRTCLTFLCINKRKWLPTWHEHLAFYRNDNWQIVSVLKLPSSQGLMKRSRRTKEMHSRN